MVKTSISQNRLKQVLDYNPETGLFTWIANTGCKPMAGKVAGTKHNRGYISIGLDGKHYLAHRLAWLYMNGCFPKEVDHIDHVRDNNAYSNLRAVTTRINAQNRSKPRDNASGVIGVYWCKLYSKWRARITAEGRTHHLGLFNDIKDAAKARKQAEAKYRFHPNHGA